MKFAKRILALTLCAIMTVSLAACGNKKGQNEGPIEQEKEYVYVPEYLSLPAVDENTWYNELQIIDGSLYYGLARYDEAADESTESIMKYSLTGGEPQEILAGDADSGSMSKFGFDKAGNIYVCYTIWGEYNEAAGNSERQYLLRKYAADGSMVYEQDITETMLKDEENSYIQNMAVDAEGRVYISSSNLIRLFDEQGAPHGEVASSGNWINGMGTDKNGGIYICYYDYETPGGGSVLAKVDYDRKQLGDTYSGLPGMNGSGFGPGIDKDFLLYDSTGLYEYDLASKTYDTILKWLDSDINGDYVQAVGAADGQLFAITRDWETASGSDTEIIRLAKTSTSDIQQKTELTIGTMYQDQMLQATAVAFNKSNDKYRVNIRSYMDTSGTSENSYEDAMTQLNNDITSGTNCPDILDLSNINEKQFAAKGVFEDLTPYMEKSSSLKKDAFVDGILDNFAIDGKIYGIPRTVQINTLVGKTSVVGDREGWSLQEMMEVAEKYPGASLFEGVEKASMLYMCMLFNDGAFIDWDTGTCKFDTPEFVQLLEFVNMFPDEVDWDSYDSSVEKYVENKVLLEAASLSELNEVQYYKARFGDEPVTFIGFPTVDGSSGCAMSANGRYAMSANSANKDGVWEFLEFYLTRESSMFDWGMYTIQSKLDKQIEEATKEEYVLDENGEIMYDEDGNPITTSYYGGGTIISDGWEYTYHTPTQEEVDLVLEMLAKAKPIADNNGSETISIIQEEAEAFFKGQKTAEDVAAIIQNRLQVYVSENS